MIRLFSYSLSLRLLAIFLLLAALFAWGVVAGIRWAYSADDLRTLISGHLSLHVDYVRQDIGSPPRLDRALAITQRVPVDIHIEGPGVRLVFRPGFPGSRHAGLRPQRLLQRGARRTARRAGRSGFAVSGRPRFISSSRAATRSSSPRRRSPTSAPVHR